jgi:putative tricarboxylic transport membrane protein
MSRSDRILGAVCLLLGVALIWGATRIQTGFIVDPLGPQTFPIIIGCVLVIGSLWLLFKPDAPPQWPAPGRFLEVLGAAVVMLGYALALERLGFVITTAVAAALLGWRLGSPPLAAVLAGTGISLGIYAIFHLILGLSLATGPLGF